jgi:hypothetical protein
VISVLKKQGVCRINYYVKGHRKHVGPDKWLKKDKKAGRKYLLDDDRDRP